MLKINERNTMQLMSSYGRGAVRSKYYLEVLGLTGCMLLIFLMCAPGPVMAIEYGKTGPYTVSRKTVQNPLNGSSVSVFLPNTQARVPVMFFSHGLGGNYYQGYRSLLTHVASQGIAVVFSPYPTQASWSQQYDILWSGFQEATNVYSYAINLDYVGFFGHSWGGGATPNMAHRAIEKGWGRSGLLMFIMAPGPSYGLTDQQYQALNSGSLIVQTFEKDTIVPESIAKSIFSKLGIPSTEKAYYYVLGGNHFEPSDRSVNNYDSLAIWTPLDALMDYEFNLGNPAGGKAFALYGEGTHWSTNITIPAVKTEPPAEEPPAEEPPAEEPPVVEPPAEEPPAEEPRRRWWWWRR